MYLEKQMNTNRSCWKDQSNPNIHKGVKPGSKVLPVQIKGSVHFIPGIQFNPSLVQKLNQYPQPLNSHLPRCSTSLVLLQNNGLVAHSLKKVLHVVLGLII